MVSPSFSEPSVAEWLVEAADRGLQIDIMSAWHYWDQGLFNDGHDSAVELVGAAGQKNNNTRILNIQHLQVHAKMMLFHGPVHVEKNGQEGHDHFADYLDTCTCPFLLTSANIYPGMWRERELGVVLCDCIQWHAIFDEVYNVRHESERVWRNSVQNLSLIGSVTSTDNKLEAKELFHILDSDTDGYLSRSDEFHGSVVSEKMLRVAHVHGKTNISFSEFVQTWEGTGRPAVAHAQSSLYV